LWFQKKRWKCEIPIGSNVKLRRVMAAILNFRSANDSQVKYRTTQWSFLQSHNSIGLVFLTRRFSRFQPIRTRYWLWQPCWISDLHQKHKSGRGPSNEHLWQVWLKSVQKKS
jgi:hypothetical protein